MLKSQSKVVPAALRPKPFPLDDELQGYFYFSNPLLNQSFKKFRRSQTSFWTFSAVHIFVIVTFLVLKWFAYANFPTTMGLANMFIPYISPGLTGFILMIMLYYKKESRFCEKWSPLLGTLWYIGANVSQILGLMMAASNGDCPKGKSSFGCFHALPGEIPSSTLIFSLFYPAILAMIVKLVDFPVIIGCWLAQIFFIVGVMEYYDYYVSSSAFAITVALTLILIYENQRQSVSLFITNQKLLHTLSENERLSNEVQANEMRRMIGNVAHELKTPLAAFNYGIEIIADIADIKNNSGVASHVYSPKARSSSMIITQHDQSNSNNISNMMNIIIPKNSILNSSSNINVDNNNRASSLSLPNNHGINNNNNDNSTASNSTNSSQHQQVVAINTNTNNKTPRGDGDNASNTTEINTLAHELEVYKYKLSNIYHTACDIRNINAFMTMSVNRCVDYTKASNDIQLVALNESVILQQAIEFSVNIMKNIQNRIEIKLLPMPDTICSHIITDKQWLQENILCLISNAVKHSRNCGFVTLKVELNSAAESPQSLNFRTNNLHSYFNFNRNKMVSHDAKYIRIEVEDTGIGINDKKIESLFALKKQSSHVNTTGLGLFSLARRVEALNGYYGAQKRRDGQQGSLFWFEIPYRPDLITKNVSLENMRDTTAVSIHSSININNTTTNITTNNNINHNNKAKLQILIVDNSLTIQKMTSVLFTRQGHTVTIAENGFDAIEKIMTFHDQHKKSYDVILMEFNMPVMDGFEATERIRRLEGLGIQGNMRQFIIGVSANSDRGAIQSGYNSGIDAFLQKPFTLQNFYDIYLKYKC